MERRRFLAVTGGSATALAGCALSPPSSSPPPYQTLEIDDGPVFAPGLQDEAALDFYATLLTSASEAAFDLGALDDDQRQFVEETDYRRAYVGVVQVAGLNSSMELWVVDIAATDVNLGLILSVEDEPPHSDDRVITTLLVRIEETPPPDGIWVQLSIGGRTETFSGGRPNR